MKKPPWGGWRVVLGLRARLCSCQSVEEMAMERQHRRQYIPIADVLLG